ncbi:MAG: methyltransferase [Eubacteriaceae bacterium]|nr:methyltransferase [Eubacteriaceae bacterium]
MLDRVPFNKDEITNAGEYPPFFPGFPPAKKFATPITPKENIQALYRRELPLWIPLSTDSRLFAPRVDPDNIARCLVLEANGLSPEEMVGGKDKHGIDWVFIPQAGGSMVVPGNPVLSDANDWESVIQFPELDSWDWEGSIQANKAGLESDERAMTIWIQTGLFERLISFMDFEGAAIAVIDEDQKDAVKALMDRLADMYIDIIGRYTKAYNPTTFTLHDDWGSQRSPFFSLETVMEMVVPALSRVVQGAHDNGLNFDMHSCGKNELLVPAYIAAGCDSWSGQPMNDKAMLFEKYGDQIILGIEADIAFTPETTAEEAAACAKRFVEKYGPTMAEKPVLCSAMMASPIFTETLYEESRKMFN